MTVTRLFRSLLFPGVCSALLLSSCAYMPDWIGGDDKEKASGERVSLLTKDNNIDINKEATNIPFSLPAETATSNVPATSVSYEGRTDHFALDGNLEELKGFDLETENDGDLAYLPPILGAGKAYTLDAEGRLQCREGDNYKKTCWSVRLSGDGTFRYGGMVLREGVLYVSGGGVEAFAIDAKDGKIIWQKTLSGVVRGVPAIYRTMVVFGTLTGRAYALDRNTGESRWTHEGTDTTLTYAGAGSPAVFQDVVFVPYPSGEIFALNGDTGVSLWNRVADSKYLRASTAMALNDSGITPQIYRGYVFLAANAGHASINDVHSGTPIWQNDIAVIRDPWPAANELFMIAENNILVGVHVPTGGVRWTSQLPRYTNAKKKYGNVRVSDPVLAGGRLYIATDNGVLLAVSPKNGDILKEYDIPDNVRHAPIVANGNLYIMDPDGDVTVFGRK